MLLTNGWGLCVMCIAGEACEICLNCPRKFPNQLKKKWSGDQIHMGNKQEMLFFCISQTVHSICSISQSLNKYLYLCLCFLLTNYPPVYSFLQEKQGLERDYTCMIPVKRTGTNWNFQVLKSGSGCWMGRAFITESLAQNIALSQLCFFHTFIITIYW